VCDARTGYDRRVVRNGASVGSHKLTAYETKNSPRTGIVYFVSRNELTGRSGDFPKWLENRTRREM
jgi:hypothetical protein